MVPGSEYGTPKFINAQEQPTALARLLKNYHKKPVVKKLDKRPEHARIHATSVVEIDPDDFGELPGGERAVNVPLVALLAVTPVDRGTPASTVVRELGARGAATLAAAALP